MKKLGLFFLIISSLVFYIINSNSSLLKEKFEVYQDVDTLALSNIAYTENNFITVSSSAEHPQFLCVKSDSCYYCKLKHKEE